MKNYWKYIISIILILSLVFSIRSCNEYKHKYNIAKNNIEAINDTIKIISNKLGEHIYTINQLQGDLTDVKSLNEYLYDEIYSLQKSIKLKEKIIQGTSFKSEIEYSKRDTIWQIKDSTINLSMSENFDFSNEFRTLNGNVYINNNNLGINILNDKINVRYTIMSDENGKLYIKSNNPYAEITEIDSFILPKQKNKKFSVGPYIGVEYDFSNNRVLPSIGISLQYSLFKF